MVRQSESSNIVAQGIRCKAQGMKFIVLLPQALSPRPFASWFLATTPRFDSTGDFEDQHTALKSSTDLISEFELDVIAKFSGPNLIFSSTDAGSYLLGKLFSP